MPAWSVASAPVSSLPGPPVTSEPGDLARRLIRIGRASGLAAVGVAPVGVFASTREDLYDRKDRGLHGGMQFTFRNPDRSTDPTRLMPGARSLVVGAWGYRRDGDDRVGPSDADARTRPTATVARYARRDHYASLRRSLEPVAEELRDRGWRARVVCDDNGLVDRAAAHRAGLGWFGKNSLILLPGLGSWFVLGTVVTDARVEPTPASEPTAPGAGCRSCTRCLAACPTGALVEPGVLDARKCLAWLVQAPGAFPEEHRRALGGRIYGCDECQEVCPINRLADRRHPPAGSEPDTVATVDLLDLLAASDGELLDRHGRWYIAGRDPRYLRRNALVALGNVGDGTDGATTATLRHWMAADDPLLAEHARWAARELGVQPGAAEDRPEGQR